MKKLKPIFKSVSSGLTILFCLICLLSCNNEDCSNIDYNVVWNTQSFDATGSMPLGGGNLGLNVWVENGELHAPGKTTVEGILKDGEIESLKVNPESRAKDVINCYETEKLIN